MIKFEDLELGKEYILINKTSWGSINYNRIKVIRKGHSLPINYDHELLTDQIHSYVGYLCLNDNKKYEDIATISTYRDEHLNYRYFNLGEDIESQLSEIINEYREDELKEINSKYDNEKQQLETKLNDIKNTILKLSKNDLKEDKKKKKKDKNGGK